MKINIIKIAYILSVTLLLIACDEISKPYLQDGNNNPIDTNYERKIILEDYTGFKCINCPRAHEAAHALSQQYGDNVIIVSVHASVFAIPDKNHPYDFRTATGTEWDNFFGMSSSGLPKGMINRIGFPETSHILSYSAWSGAVANALTQKPIVKLELTSDYNSSNGKIDVNVDYKYNDALDKYHNLNVLIVEDSIISYQAWSGHEPEHVFDYVHMHALRVALNGTWGEELTTQSGNKKYSYTIATGSDWKPKDLKVIAFISDVGNTYEIYQAEETKLNMK